MTNQHGGPRPGAGRKPGVPLPWAAHRTRRMIMLSDTEWDQARMLGEGKASAGVRKAIAVATSVTAASAPPSDKPSSD